MEAKPREIYKIIVVQIYGCVPAVKKKLKHVVMDCHKRSPHGHFGLKLDMCLSHFY